MLNVSRSALFVLPFSFFLTKPAAAQEAAAALERVSFQEAVTRAISAHPSVRSAAAEILRAEALVRQAQSVVLPSVSAGVATTTIDSARTFDDRDVVPRTQMNANVSVGALLYAPDRWARRAQAEDLTRIAESGVGDAKRQIALAAAQAYLAIIAQRRVLDVRMRARDTARSHFELARQRRVGGTGSLLNELRAQQELSSDESLVEEAQLAVRRAQEALGVLTASDRGLDAAEDPVFDIPANVSEDDAVVRQRPDVQLFTARVAAAQRIVSDSWKEYLPSLAGVFEPQYQNPASLFTPSRSWRAQLLFSVPLFDAGLRAGRAAERKASLTQSEASLAGSVRQARADIRIAQEAVHSADRALASARAAAEQAQQVVEIVNVAFKAGATTNIEVIDAQRRARDADTAVAVVEDTARRARLELLAAIGRFP
jgi:outer membrane protein TolC